MNSLEKTVENKNEQYAELNQKYTRLSEDFKYNLKLINDRDKELSTFDTRLKGCSSFFFRSLICIKSFLFRYEKNSQ